MEWYVPLLVFLARICDVSIGTVRIIVVIRGHKLWAALLGFVEVTIWLFAVAAVIGNIREYPLAIIAYAGGFAMGNLVGMLIEEKIALGNQIIRAVSTDPSLNVSQLLRDKGYQVTQVAAHGVSGPAELCFVVVPRRKAQRVMDEILGYSPESFITVEDIRQVAGASLFGAPATQLEGWKRLIKFR